MARIAGVNIPTQKRVEIALTYIHGIGRTTSTKICESVGIPQERRVHELTEDEVARLREVIDRDQVVEGDLRRKIAMDIKRLMDLGYRGLRHLKACRCADSGPIPTRGPVRARRRLSRVRRSNSGFTRQAGAAI